MSSSLRKDNETVAHDAIKPDFLKSDAEKAGDKTTGKVDNLMSHVVGEPRDAVNPKASDHATQAHDTGRKGVVDTVADAVRPAGQETTGETVSRKAEDAKSHLEPNANKSTGQSVLDTVTSGHKGAGEAGITDQIVNAATAVKDTIANAVSPNNHGAANVDRKNEL